MDFPQSPSKQSSTPPTRRSRRVLEWLIVIGLIPAIGLGAILVHPQYITSALDAYFESKDYYPPLVLSRHSIIPKNTAANRADLRPSVMATLDYGADLTQHSAAGNLPIPSGYHYIFVFLSDVKNVGSVVNTGSDLRLADTEGHVFVPIDIKGDINIKVNDITFPVSSVTQQVIRPSNSSGPSFLLASVPLNADLTLSGSQPTISPINLSIQQCGNECPSLSGLALQSAPPAPSYAADEYRVIFTSVPIDNSDAGRKALQPYLDQSLAYLRWLHFPKSLMDGMVIGIISPTFQGGDVSIGREIFNISKTTYGPGSTEGITFASSNRAYGIFFPAYMLQSGFYATLTHELGHVIAKQMTSADWIKWAVLRGAPNTNYSNDTWETTPEEDFAEEYKVAFGNHQGDPKSWENRTSWGKRQCTPEEMVERTYFGSCLVDTPAPAQVIAFMREILKRVETQ